MAKANSPNIDPDPTGLEDLEQLAANANQEQRTSETLQDDVSEITENALYNIL